MGRGFESLHRYHRRTIIFDPRCTPYRKDLAATSLKGLVEAEHFVEGVTYSVRVGCCPVFESPNPNARQTSQLLFGENFTVYEKTQEWCWGQNQTDHYVGYTHASGLSQHINSPTHWITALATFVYQEPNIKSRSCDRLSLTSEVHVTDETEKFLFIPEKGWIYRQHTQPLENRFDDHLKAAEYWLHVPYLWGGRSSLGIDCSGLLQLSLATIGIRAPRDSDMQQHLGYPVTLPKPGDLAFFPGHCGIFGHNNNILHANAFTMSVAYESLEDVRMRIPEKEMTVKRVSENPKHY